MPKIKDPDKHDIFEIASMVSDAIDFQGDEPMKSEAVLNIARILMAMDSNELIGLNKIIGLLISEKQQEVVNA